MNDLRQKIDACGWSFVIRLTIYIWDTLSSVYFGTNFINIIIRAANKCSLGMLEFPVPLNGVKLVHK